MVSRSSSKMMRRGRVKLGEQNWGVIRIMKVKEGLISHHHHHRNVPVVIQTTQSFVTIITIALLNQGTFAKLAEGTGLKAVP